jgi:hypothetical protein
VNNPFDSRGIANKSDWLYNWSSLLENQMPLFKTDSELTEFLDFLGDLSIDGETFEICLSALKLQSALKELYGINLL